MLHRLFNAVTLSFFHSIFPLQINCCYESRTAPSFYFVMRRL
jgi:hypothetical protein